MKALITAAILTIVWGFQTATAHEVSDGNDWSIRVAAGADIMGKDCKIGSEVIAHIASNTHVKLLASKHYCAKISWNDGVQEKEGWVVFGALGKAKRQATNGFFHSITKLFATRTDVKSQGSTAVLGTRGVNY